MRTCSSPVTPRSPRAWVARCGVLNRAGRAQEAATLLGEAVRRMPREPALLIAWANEALRRKEWAEAARRFERARQHAPKRIEGYEWGPTR